MSTSLSSSSKFGKLVVQLPCHLLPSEIISNFLSSYSSIIATVDRFPSPPLPSRPSRLRG
ncbi:hypothetical protein [Aerosakkonema funiforme]|uniref:hypothetical protein n=1 Tax=Aerosakkonema funiforme TaxID=1246630 RepID=UPI0035BC1F26